MSFQNEPIFLWLSEYAYEPQMVYLAVIAMMIASGFGLPLPEEVTIVSIGILTYMGAHPEIFPPPYPDAPVIHGIEAAAVTLTAVLFSDLLVFSIGRIFGRKLMKLPWLSGEFSSKHMETINSWLRNYGVYAAFLFRFTPGIRFPAHIAFGMSRFSAWQFALIDGTAALISVPTQILLIYWYGEPILHILHKFKFWILILVFASLAVFLIRKYLFKKPN